jgi:hypothetical protein
MANTTSGIAPRNGNESPAVTTEAQKEARRRNGKKSRGPRTERGKAASSMNALKHGVFARALLPRGLFARESVLRNALAGESKDEFQALLYALDEVFSPADAFEQTLVEKMALALWRTRRLRRHERALGEEDLHRFETSPFMKERGGRIDAEVERIAARRCLPNAEELEKILRYEAALEREFYRCYAILERRKQQQGCGEENAAAPFHTVFHIG